MRARICGIVASSTGRLRRTTLRTSLRNGSAIAGFSDERVQDTQGGIMGKSIQQDTTHNLLIIVYIVSSLFCAQFAQRHDRL